MTTSLKSFKYKQPKEPSIDELLLSRPDISTKLVQLNEKYQAASKHYKRCVNKQSSYLLSSQTDKATSMREMVDEMRLLKTKLIKKRKELEESLLHEEVFLIRNLPE